MREAHLNSDSSKSIQPRTMPPRGEKRRWEIQEWSLCDGWLNAWTDCYANGDVIPVTFASEEEAEEELRAYLEERPDYSEDEFQIVSLDQHRCGEIAKITNDDSDADVSSCGLPAVVVQALRDDSKSKSVYLCAEHSRRAGQWAGAEPRERAMSSADSSKTPLTIAHRWHAAKSPLDCKNEKASTIAANLRAHAEAKLDGRQVAASGEGDRAGASKGAMSGLPWPTYHNGQQFVCDKCGARFDTSTGHAIHEVYGCDSQRIPAPVVNRTLPSCPTCGSFALHRERNGTITCQTCTICGPLPTPKEGL
jgi:hypothetical protein